MTDDKASLEREKDGIGITYKSGDADDLATKIELILNNSDEFKKNLLISIPELKKKYDYNKISQSHNIICNKIINEFKK